MGNEAWEKAEEARARASLSSPEWWAAKIVRRYEHDVPAVKQRLWPGEDWILIAEVRRLRAAFPILAEEADDALRRISEWAGAYPNDVFPDVDLKKARAALSEAGIEIGALHATWARHIMQGIGAIADGGRARIEQMKEQS
jgi:hypothetical protein